MPIGVRFSEVHLMYLAGIARANPNLAGFMCLKNGDVNVKWQKRWVILYQNFLFYFESPSCAKPLGFVFLEHSTIDLRSLTKLKDLQNQFTLYIAVPEDSEEQKLFLRANNEEECNMWLEALRYASYASLQLEKKELEERYLLSSHILEAEQEANRRLVVQCEEYEQRIQSLENHLSNVTKGDKLVQENEVESEDIKKIKKVQSLVRAWLCRRRWHSVVKNYIESGHASSIKQRNQLIFCFVQEEEEYVKDLSTLVVCFLRPFRMAASARKPPTTHEQINCIFLNCEIILFLHQIFLKGLQTRMENWPTLVLGDLFRVLLPMYGIYQEYVRNHHYGLQTLAECKQSSCFNRLLRIHEEKPECEDRSLEIFLTLPMHRIPRYIITLHRLLAVTPPNHVDRPSFEHAQSVLEDLSLLMHDEVSETENIRKNLSIERQIVGGCEELLDVQQILIRQGSLIQVLESNKKLKTFGSLGIKPHERKEYVRHCFLFSGLLLIATRSSNGKLHLQKTTGKLPLSDVTLVEGQYEDNLDVIVASSKSEHTLGYEEMALRIVVNSKDGEAPVTITLVAQTAHEKAAWISDLKQCIENVSLVDSADSPLPFSRHCFTRNDPSLSKDDVDIKYSNYLNSCRVPRIRYASLERLFDRLLDLRFLSVEFLNTFLITYRIFTDAETILKRLETFYEKRQRSLSLPMSNGDIRLCSTTLRTCSLKEKRFGRHLQAKAEINGFLHEDHHENHEENEDSPPVRPTTLQIPSLASRYRRNSSPSALGESNVFQYPQQTTETSDASRTVELEQKKANESRTVKSKQEKANESTRSELFLCNHLNCGRSRTNSSPASELPETLQKTSASWNDCENTISCNGKGVLPETSSDSVCQSRTVPEIARTGRSRHGFNHSIECIPVITTECSSSDVTNDQEPTNNNTIILPSDKERISVQKQTANGVSCGFSLGLERSTDVAVPEKRPNSCPKTVGKRKQTSLQNSMQRKTQENPSPKHSKSSQSLHERRRDGKDKKLFIVTPSESKGKGSIPVSPNMTNSSKAIASPGAVVTSSKASKRRTSNTMAAAAFAAATAGAICSPCSPLLSPSHHRFSFREVQGPLARILTILNHWLIKHRQDFQKDPALQSKLRIFLDKVKTSEKTANEKRSNCNTILRSLDNNHEQAADEKLFSKIFLHQIPKAADAEISFDKLSSTQLAEQLTLTEHLLFSRIASHEFLNLSWMKSDKEIRAPNILKVSQRFNEVSRLVASEILCRSTASSRAAAIEKWVVVAEVCRNLCNYNAVLEIISALMSSSVYRLKKTREKLSKQTKALIDKLQALVSTNGRFKNMREALRCSNPPCIPYLGFYLTDLAFIEEGTSVKNENGLINFSKMRMIAQVVEEIRHYQEIRYNIQHDPKITEYLFCKDILMDENLLYKRSLTWEPKKRPSIRLKGGDSQEANFC